LSKNDGLMTKHDTSISYDRHLVVTIVHITINTREMN